MKIYSSTVVQNVYQAYGKNKVGKTQKSGEVGSPGFDIQISNQGKDYQLAIEKLKQIPDVRADKVSAIKQSIEKLGYKVLETEKKAAVDEDRLRKKKKFRYFGENSPYRQYSESLFYILQWAL